MRSFLITLTALALQPLAAQQVNGYRYWINDDAASEVTASLTPGTVVQLNSLIDLAALPETFNTITFQFASDSGAWSVPITRYVQRNTGLVNGYEYWLDDAFASRVNAPIGPAGVVDLIADLPMPTVFGDHLFTIRFSSADGTWSVPLSSEFFFFTSVEELPGVEDLLLFPNPVNDHLGLRLRTTNASGLNILILDATGRTVLDGGNWSVQGEALRQWDLSALSAGAYSVRIMDTATGRAAALPFVKP